MPKKIENAKIACLDFSIQKTKMKLGVEVNFIALISRKLHNSVFIKKSFFGEGIY